jgi:hypothetical protein
MLKLTITFFCITCSSFDPVIEIKAPACNNCYADTYDTSDVPDDVLPFNLFSL